MFRKIMIFTACFLCALVILSIGLKKAACQASLPLNLSFSADSSNFYFFDKDKAEIYKYNTQGKLIRIYVVKELGKDFISK